MHQLLSNLEEDRWSWVKEGINEFREGFLRLSPSQSTKKEALIGVYGPTQVGKTTLILKILGIRNDKMEELSNSLRGKRTIGNSATITATIYHRSTDNSFLIVYPNGEEKQFLTLKEFEQGMEELRVFVENDRHYSTKPIHIFFSESYFDLLEIDTRTQNITILDLPGDDSREERELRHVDRCLREYLPHCRLCLVMEIGGQMVNLTQITREHVRDWIYLPDRFRVVLTRTLTSSSVREKINQKTIHSTASYIEHFKYELNRLLKKERRVERLYPLELGDSWQGLKKSVPDFYNMVSPWIDEVYEQLLEDIKAVESPEREIIQLLNLEDLAQKRKQEENLNLKRQIDSVKKKQEDVEISIKSYEKRIEQVNDEIKQLEDLATNKSRLKKYKQFKFPAIYGIASWSNRSSREKYVSSLQNDFSDCLNQLQKDYEKAVKLWNQSLRFIVNDYGLPFSPISFTFIEEYCSIDRMFNRYFRESTFLEDRNRCEMVLKRVSEKNRDQITRIVLGKVDELLVQIKKQIRAKHISIEEYTHSRDRSKIQKNRLNNTLQQLERDLEKAKIEWDHDIERTNELNLYLKKAFTKKATEFYELLNSDDIDLESKWAYHLYWNIITKDAERIIRNDTDNRTII